MTLLRETKKHPGSPWSLLTKGFIWPPGWEPGWPMVPQLLVLGRTAADVSIERKERSFGRREGFSEVDTAAAVVCRSDCGRAARGAQPARNDQAGHRHRELGEIMTRKIDFTVMYATHQAFRRDLARITTAATTPAAHTPPGPAAWGNFQSPHPNHPTHADPHPA